MEGQKHPAEQIADGMFVTGNFTIQAQMPMGKTITVSGYIYDKNTIEDVNARINLFHDAVDYQRTKAEIPELEAKHDQMTKALSQMRDVMADLDKKQKDGGKLSSQEKLTLQNMGVNIVKVSDELAKGAEAILEAKRKVGIAV